MGFSVPYDHKTYLFWYTHFYGSRSWKHKNSYVTFIDFPFCANAIVKNTNSTGINFRVYDTDTQN